MQDKIQKIPLNLKLIRKAHKDIAYAQDLIVEMLYAFFSDAIIHGGTAIWRCYNGNRFSEDVDVYIDKNKNKIEQFFNSLKKQGFEVLKKRIKENSLYSVLSFNNTLVRFEALFKKTKSVLMEYETSEGLFLNVFTLSSEELIKEKIETYLKRRKIRDLYDVFFLLRYTEKSVKSFLKKLTKNYEPPADEENLKTILISGAVPSSKQMMQYIERWAR